MIEALISQAQLSNVAAETLRNIVSLRVSQDLFDDLSADPAARAAAERLELQVKPSAFESHVPIIDRPFEEGAYFNAIDFPFQNWSKSRYSDGRFGVWYGADSIETTVWETVHHWRNFLADADNLQAGVRIERKVYAVHCEAALIDLRQLVSSFSSLVHPSDYSLCQQLGSKLHREGHPGLITQSARCAGDVFVILNRQVLSSPRQLCYLSYISSEDGIVVEREPGTPWLHIPPPAEGN